jgi:hypothetical protein
MVFKIPRLSSGAMVNAVVWLNRGGLAHENRAVADTTLTADDAEGGRLSPPQEFPP